MGKTCIVCHGVAQLYCKNDDAFLCSACDEQVHTANVLARKHHRVRVCELCCALPASVYCTNDAAHLCAGCDASSHAGAVTARHQRVAVCEASGFDQASASESQACHEGTEEDSMFAVPEVPLVPPGVEDFPEWNSISGPLDAKSLLGKEFEQDLDIFDMDPSWLDRLDMGFDDLTQSIIDGVVPEFNDGALDVKKPTPVTNNSASTFSPFDESPLPMFDSPALHAPPALEERSRPAPARPSQYASRTLHQQQVAAAEWMPYGEVVRQDISTFIPPSLRPVDPQTILDRAADRKLRLARYREKKKNRQYKKTIRYASRKAYAEVRPRVKGRFARKEEVAAMRAAGLLPAA